MKPLRLLGIAVVGLLLVSCDQVDSTTSKASACAEALGLTNLNPNLDPAQLAAQAQQKAEQLRDLANKVADQNLKQDLSAIADSYVALEQRKAQGLSNVNDWIQRNAENLNSLRAVCL